MRLGLEQFHGAPSFRLWLLCPQLKQSTSLLLKQARRSILWMHQFMGELGYSITGPSLLRMDNQSAIAVSKNPEHHSKMKHLSLRLFWLRDAVQEGLITPSFVTTQEMAADIFTKALDRFKVQKCAGMLGLFI